MTAPGQALHLVKVTGATLIIAKLDWLSRNAAFLLNLRDSGVRFVAVDMPEGNAPLASWRWWRSKSARPRPGARKRRLQWPRRAG